MEEQAVRQKAEQFIEALHAWETAPSPEDTSALEALVSLYAGDAHLTNSALRLVSDERVGTVQIRSFWTDYKKTLGKSFSKFHQVTVNNEAAGLFWTTDGTDTSGAEGGAHYDGTTLLIFNNEGKIRFFQGYYDTRQLNREMGMEK